MRQFLLVAMAGMVSVALAGVARAQETPPPPPAAPTELVASPASNQPDVWLSWHHNGASDDSFRIERSNYGENGPWDLVIEASSMCEPPDATNCAYLDRTLQRETTYWYRIATVNSAGASPYSNVTSAHIPPLPAPGPGEIRGVVYYDRNASGARDAGEEGLQGRSIAISRDGMPIITVSTDAAGEYAYSGGTSGEYTVVASLDGGQGICSDGPATFSPFPNSSCVGVRLPWREATAGEVTVSISDTRGGRADFGARPKDIAIIVGLALLEDDYAPPGTEIRALVNGKICGSTTMPSRDGYFIGDRMFELRVLGAEELPGCAIPGDPILFQVGGVPAAQAGSFVRFTDLQTFSQFQIYYLTAIQQHAWYWFESTDQTLSGKVMQAVIDGTVCGEARIDDSQGTGLVGYSKLLVPSSELRPGCGYPDATVRFVLDGMASPGTMQWRLELNQIDPEFAPIILTSAGGGPSRGGNGVPDAVLALIAGILLLGAGSLLRRRV